MRISKEDLENLCDIAQELNETNLELWKKLNKIIENIND